MSGIINKANLIKTYNYLQKNGISAAFYAARERIEAKLKPSYVYLPPTEEELKFQKENGSLGPLVSIVVPTYNTPEIFLKEAIESVVNQTYSNWELIIADASENPDTVGKIACEYAQKVNNSESDGHTYPHIQYLHLKENKGISDNTNVGISYAHGDYIALLDHDDLLTLDALYRSVAAIKENNNPVLLYSDEDKLDSKTGTWFDHHIKYDFNYDLLLTNNYVCHFMLIRADVMKTLSLRKEYDGAQDFDLVLQAVRYIISQYNARIIDLKKYIIHIPIVLYHWRSHEASTAANTQSKLYAYEAGMRAVAEHIRLVHMSQGDSQGRLVSHGNEYINIIPANETTPLITVKHSKHLGFYNTVWGENGNDIFDIRPEVGAIVNRLVDSRGKMLPILFDSEGNSLYEGLDVHYSGEMNRFDCAQDVYAAEINCMIVRPELRELLDEFKNNSESMKFAEVLHEKGYVIIYQPTRGKE